MSAIRLIPQAVEKPWGRRDLSPCFGSVASDAPPVGEIWFEDGGNAARPLLVKYLFTSERLSIQVHPGREAARAAGYADGKDEAWLIVKAEEDAEIGLGLREGLSRSQLREAALDGTIVDLLEWRPAAAGDFHYSPAGTVHALGAGLTLIEVQQNVDATYRLYDYGRPRALHLDDAVAVAELKPFQAVEERKEVGTGRAILTEGAAFVVERWTGAVKRHIRTGADLPVWIIPVAGGGLVDGETLHAGDVWIADEQADVALDDGAEALIAYPNNGGRRDFIL